MRGTHVQELFAEKQQQQQQLEAQYAINQTLNVNMADLQMKIDLLLAQNQEYQHSASQTNDKYEEALSELSHTYEELHSATRRIRENEETVQSLNNDLLNIAHKTKNGNCKTKNGKHKNGHSYNKAHRSDSTDSIDRIDYKQKYETQLRECAEYRKNTELFIRQRIESENEMVNLQKYVIELEQKQNSLSHQIITLTHDNIHFEKEISEYSHQIHKQSELVAYLQNQNQILSNKIENETETELGLETITAMTSMASITSITSMTASPPIPNNIKSEGDITDVNIDLFTIMNEYSHNEYEESENEHKAETETDALEEYLHLTCSAIKIKYPNIEANIKELLAEVSSCPFFQAWDILDKYMLAKSDMLSKSDDTKTDVSKTEKWRLLKKMRRASVTALNTKRNSSNQLQKQIKHKKKKSKKRLGLRKKFKKQKIQHVAKSRKKSKNEVEES